MSNNRQIVFISCGQQTDEKKRLGESIASLVSELTPFEPYFAEYQTTLEGLTKNIFAALNHCVGFIAVMHPRGCVNPPGNFIRASLWVEQEIAIAAFLRGALGKPIHVAAYAYRGIELEGIRKQLLLNPKEFTDSREVLNHLRLILPSWAPPSKSADDETLVLAIEYEKERITPERHDYRLLILLTNMGELPVEKYYVELEFPTNLIHRRPENAILIQKRCTRNYSFFRLIGNNSHIIFPGETIPVMNLQYFVDEDIFSSKFKLLQEYVRAILYVEGTGPKHIEKTISQLHNF
ncbi:MAG: hypothetical protein GY738_04865 [Pseudoalteromonas sp.]|nr:hypothetical protein [Pseudoalteromonas sp.]